MNELLAVSHDDTLKHGIWFVRCCVLPESDVSAFQGKASWLCSASGKLVQVCPGVR